MACWNVRMEEAFLPSSGSFGSGRGAEEATAKEEEEEVEASLPAEASTEKPRADGGLEGRAGMGFEGKTGRELVMAGRAEAEERSRDIFCGVKGGSAGGENGRGGVRAARTVG